MVDVKNEPLLRQYVEAVLKAPSSLSLTATREPEIFWKRHVLDAVHLPMALPEEVVCLHLKIADIGSGNGIPGIPLAIEYPDWHITMIDSDNKKCGFMDSFCKINAIINATVIVGRSEELAHRSDLREAFDLVLSRALSKLPSALELSVPFLKLNGYQIVPHGTFYKEALASAEKAMKELGIELKAVIPYYSDSGVTYQALLFQKVHSTPSIYPRRTGIPSKRPL